MADVGYYPAKVVRIVENDIVEFNVEDVGLMILRVPHIDEAEGTFLVPGAQVTVFVGLDNDILHVIDGVE